MSEEKEHEVIQSGPLYDAVQEEAVAVVDDEEIILDSVFISDDDTIVAPKDLVKAALMNSMRGFDSDRIHKETDNSALVDVAKNIEGSTQSKSEMDTSGNTFSSIKVVEPPYPPELLETFLEVDETHYRCVKTKVVDAVGRTYELEPIVNVIPDYEQEDAEAALLMEPLDQLAATQDKPETAIDKLRKAQEASRKQDEDSEEYTQSEIDEESEKVNQFIDNCNEIIGFEGVLERAGMDYEAIGWAAIEIIRGKDMQIKRIAHLPAQRVRVLRGWKGFVEIKGGDTSLTEASGGQYCYYQSFGEKVVSRKRKHPITDSRVPYTPKEDGELTAANAEWYFIDRETGEPTADFDKSANEILWIPKHHSATIYYGYSDIVPALGSVLMNIHIRDYGLQFFEHNTVPRYVVVVEGAKLGKKVAEAILKYFSEHIKGKAHKTLIIPVPAMRGEVTIRFEKLGADGIEGSFQETKKNNQTSVLTAHGMSPAIVGIAEAANLGSGKGLSQAEIYKDRIVTPTQLRWQRPINKMFSRGLGITLVCLKFNPLDIRDRSAEAEVLTKYQGTGALTVNQVRKIANLGPPLKGGDRAFIIVQGQLMFIDEMTEMVSSVIEDATAQIESLQMEMEAKDFEHEQSLRDTEMRFQGNGQTTPAKPPVPA